MFQWFKFASSLICFWLTCYSLGHVDLYALHFAENISTVID